ncbi:hypothetical protein HN51_002590 [Arachis hypogaea]|uniref:GATA-type domain-containing protein n=2 Tax=Arachis TaxID=3817 RepID=A0A445ELY5_ARAHY|nr:GATA transcription factor 16 [Arachis duranensis]XP_025610681.1 GATA transcription factor 16 [Arachis hypogaea]QHO50810.1 GATA transcription factor [Arachis hypogaea]RYR76448.1 hypothetical protein Ahy_A01g001040 [Arachis hypogaea]
MVDSTGKGSDSDDASPNSAAAGKSPTTEQKKTCADCGTSKTPLWRGGPAGPKSLCNACGIRSRKKKRAILGIARGTTTTDDVKKGKRSNTVANSNNNKFGDSFSFKKRWITMARQRSNPAHTHRNKLGEEEQAAFLLMSLSYGSVYA